MVRGARCKMPPSTVELITKHIHDKYLGSKGIEAADSIDFCAYFEKYYGDDSRKARLREKLIKIPAGLGNGHRVEPTRGDQKGGGRQPRR